MSEWRNLKLGDIADVLSGYAFKSHDFSDTGIPVIKIKNIVPPTVSLNETQYYSGKLDSRLKKFLINKKDLLISLTGSTVNQMASAVGKMGRYPFEEQALLNQRVGKIFSVSEEANDDFIYYFLNRSEIQYNLALNASGSANQANISPSQIKSLDVLLPPLKTQIAIAEILSSLDDKIELNNQINENLEALAQTIFKHWFIDFEFPDENGNPYKSSGGKMVESELGLIPEGWEVKTFDGIADVTIGRTPPRKEQQWFSNDSNDIKWVSIKDMANLSVFITKSNEFLTEEAVKKFRVPIIEAGTVIVSFKLTVGRIAITAERMLSNEAIAHINLKDNQLSSEFVYLYANQFDFDSLGSTSSIATAVNSKAIKQIPIIVPKQDVMIDFNCLVKDLFKTILNCSLEINQLKNLRDALLPKILTGDLQLT